MTGKEAKLREGLKIAEDVPQQRERRKTGGEAKGDRGVEDSCRHTTAKGEKKGQRRDEG